MTTSASSRTPERRYCPVCERRFGPRPAFCPFDGAVLSTEADQPWSDPLLGQIIDGRYVVEDVLGEGGMGRVYRARHQVLGRPFAVKVLRRDLVRDPLLSERFLHEARAVAAILHPNVVKITDYGVLSSEQPYFVMPLLTGMALGRLIQQRGRLTVLEARIFGREIARGLGAAHRAAVIHRDLKPDNVFLTHLDQPQPRVVLLDFGLAKLLGGRRLTQEGVVFGTPQYMSPEQISGETIDHRVDVYALGIVLYEMLRGRPPFEADSYHGVLTKQLFSTPPPLREVLDGDTELGEMHDLILACLAKEADQRLGDMDAVIERLEALAPPLPDLEAGRLSWTSVPPPPVTGGEGGEEPVKVLSVRPPAVAPIVPVRRRSSLWLGLGLFSLALSATALILSLRAPSLPEPPEPSSSLVQIPPPQPEFGPVRVVESTTPPVPSSSTSAPKRHVAPRKLLPVSFEDTKNPQSSAPLRPNGAPRPLSSSQMVDPWAK